MTARFLGNENLDCHAGTFTVAVRHSCRAFAAFISRPLPSAFRQTGPTQRLPDQPAPKMRFDRGRLVPCARAKEDFDREGSSFRQGSKIIEYICVSFRLTSQFSHGSFMIQLKYSNVISY